MAPRTDSSASRFWGGTRESLLAIRRTSSTVRARTLTPPRRSPRANRSAPRVPRPVEATLRPGNFHWISGVDCCTAGGGERFLVTPALTCAFPMWTSMWTSVNHTSDIPEEGRSPTGKLTRTVVSSLDDTDPPRRLLRLQLLASRRCAHSRIPRGYRMLELLRREPLSASELARGGSRIRFGSARFHLQQLVRGGLAQPAGDRRGARRTRAAVHCARGRARRHRPRGAGDDGRHASRARRGARKPAPSGRHRTSGAGDSDRSTSCPSGRSRLTPDGREEAQRIAEEALRRIRALDAASADGAEPVTSASSCPDGRGGPSISNHRTSAMTTSVGPTCCSPTAVSVGCGRRGRSRSSATASRSRRSCSTCNRRTGPVRRSAPCSSHRPSRTSSVRWRA